MTNEPSSDAGPGRMLRLVDLLLGAMTLLAAVAVFVGANLVALILMTGGRAAEPGTRELRH